MELSAAFIGLGRTALDELVRKISLGTLKSFKVYDTFKVRTRLNKLNTENLRKAAPRLWERLEQGDQELAENLASAILVSNTTFVAAVLDFLTISHDGNGFFQKDASIAERLTDGWQQRVLEEFRGRHPEALVKLYINHLTWETDKNSEPFAG